MNREQAEKVIACAMGAGSHLNDIVLLADAMPDQAEKLALRRSVGEILSALYVDIMRPVIAAYPDLDPDK